MTATGRRSDAELWALLDNARVQLWFCPVDHPRTPLRETVRWHGEVATCLDCGRTNRDAPAPPPPDGLLRPHRRGGAELKHTMAPEEPKAKPDTTCPHCGVLVMLGQDGRTVSHSWPLPTRQVCPGSQQIARRKPNPHTESTP